MKCENDYGTWEKRLFVRCGVCGGGWLQGLAKRKSGFGKRWSGLAKRESGLAKWDSGLAKPESGLAKQ